MSGGNIYSGCLLNISPNVQTPGVFNQQVVAGHTVIQAVDNTIPFVGVSQLSIYENYRSNPLNLTVAETGQGLRVFQIGETAVVTMGAQCQVGDLIGCNASGLGVPTTNPGDNIVGMAMGTAYYFPKFVQVYVQPGVVPGSLKVTTQPISQTVATYGNATFISAATGIITPITVQWQVSTDNGMTWSNVTGATNTTLVVEDVQPFDSGDLYRAQFTNTIQTVNSNSATLTVTVPSKALLNTEAQYLYNTENQLITSL